MKSNILRSLPALLLCWTTLSSYAADLPKMRLEDRQRIRIAMDIAEHCGERLWVGHNKVPFTIILVTDSVEFVVAHPTPSTDLISLGNDEIMRVPIHYRPRVFPVGLLATFPAINGHSCIVVGTPEATGKDPIEWTITLLHEHFHQYQTSDPGYYAAVDALGLANGDESGMWMLNYPFPYDDDVIKTQYQVLASTLSTALKDTSAIATTEYYRQRQVFSEMLSPKDRAYFNFQLWQEGLARYTEYKFLEILSDPSSDCGVQDREPYSKALHAMYRNELQNLSGLSLSEGHRICFYSIGWAEGILLDRAQPGWRSRYLQEKFTTLY